MADSREVLAILGDSREVLAGMEPDSFDSCVCDPPYALTGHGRPHGHKLNSSGTDLTQQRNYIERGGFMGQKWDTGETAFDPAFWAEVMRVLKPGAHLLAFGGTRTYHRLTCAIEDAGFEIRDAVLWHYGSGLPKSHDVSKGIDKAQRRAFVVAAVDMGMAIPGNSLHDWTKGGHSPDDRWWEQFKRVLSTEQWQQIERAVIAKDDKGRAIFGSCNGEYDITAPATDAAREWAGWGTALKPATEIVCLARKPLSEPTIAANVLRWGTGALNIDGCRVVTETTVTRRNGNSGGNGAFGRDERRGQWENPPGRWPANLILDGSEEVLAGFPETGASRATAGRNGRDVGDIFALKRARDDVRGHNDSGSAARFFYHAKANKADRAGSKHPTIKPVDLMAYLIRLVTRPGGLVLDPFAGSGPTGEAAIREGCKAVLIEREPAYHADIERRLKQTTAA